MIIYLYGNHIAFSNTSIIENVFKGLTYLALK